MRVFSYKYRYTGKDGKVKYAKSVVQAKDATAAKNQIIAKHPSAYRFIQVGNW